MCVSWELRRGGSIGFVRFPVSSSYKSVSRGIAVIFLIHFILDTFLLKYAEEEKMSVLATLKKDSIAQVYGLQGTFYPGYFSPEIRAGHPPSPFFLSSR